MAEERAGVLQGFKDFVMRGNVMDLAVAVVVGAAFTAVIAAFNDNIIAPVLAAVGGADTAGFGFCVRSGAEPCTSESATFVDLGAVFGVILSFLITMAVVYFVFVLPMNRARSMSARKAEAQEEAAPTPADVVLLTEIRDLLAVQGSAPTATAGPTPGQPLTRDPGAPGS